MRRASCRAPALEGRRLALVEALGPIVIGLLGLLAKRSIWPTLLSSPGNVDLLSVADHPTAGRLCRARRGARGGRARNRRRQQRQRERRAGPHGGRWIACFANGEPKPTPPATGRDARRQRRGARPFRTRVRPGDEQNRARRCRARRLRSHSVIFSHFFSMRRLASHTSNRFLERAAFG
jgi:hypothetical protein